MSIRYLAVAKTRNDLITHYAVYLYCKDTRVRLVLQHLSEEKAKKVASELNTALIMGAMNKIVEINQNVPSIPCSLEHVSGTSEAH